MDTPTPRLANLPPCSEAARPSMTIIEVGTRQYRVEFWPDMRWNHIPMKDRPEAMRADTDDGWFAFTRIG